MTNSSRKILLSLLTVLLPAMASAQTPPAKPAAPPPKARPVIVPAPNQQFQRQVNQQQLQNRQNQNALREQLRQDNLGRQRDNATDPALRNQLDNADRSQQQMYRARQEDALRRNQTLQRQDPTGNAPARTSTTGR